MGIVRHLREVYLPPFDRIGSRLNRRMPRTYLHTQIALVISKDTSSSVRKSPPSNPNLHSKQSTQDPDIQSTLLATLHYLKPAANTPKTTHLKPHLNSLLYLTSLAPSPPAPRAPSLSLTSHLAHPRPHTTPSTSLTLNDFSTPRSTSIPIYIFKVAISPMKTPLDTRHLQKKILTVWLLRAGRSGRFRSHRSRVVRSILGSGVVLRRCYLRVFFGVSFWGFFWRGGGLLLGR